jgi:hypothetical protein
MTTSSNVNDESTGILNKGLLRAVTKINTLLLATVFGFVGGLGLFSVTYMSLLRGLPQPGHYLNLLGVFLPGYNVSHSGAWVGLFWGALIGALLAAIFYRIYARTIPIQVQDYLREGAVDGDLLSAPMKFDGNYLGLVLGTIISGGLIVTTNWLVLRGTAEDSVHAQLLVNYLPGYSVSMAGSLIGALELFATIYVLSHLFSWIYNSIVLIRIKNPR